MNNQKLYELAVSMLRKFDNETDHDFAETILKNPVEFVEKFPEQWFYADAAKMVLELQTELFKEKSGSKSDATKKLQSLKNILRNAKKSIKSYELSGIFSDNENMFVVCDGYRAIRSKNDIPVLEHLEKERGLKTIDKIVNDTKSIATEKHTLDIADLKKAIVEKRKTDDTGIYEICKNVFVNAKYMLDMVNFFGNEFWIVPNDSKRHGIIFQDENGCDGILLQVRA